MIRLLMIEQDALYAELTLRTLRSSGLSCACERVINEEEFRKALARSPDLILGCGPVQDLEDFAALAIAKAAKPSAPFIFLSGQSDVTVARRAVEAGAAHYILKSELARLPSAVRSALQPSVVRQRRTSDESSAAAIDLNDTASFLIERRDILERSLGSGEPASLSSILTRTPPAQVALVLIRSESIRGRYLKVLHSAGIETEVAVEIPDALASLAERIHTLLFTDQLEFVRAARQLETGSATHVIFIRGGETGDSEYLRAGANEVMPEEARGERFWAHLTIARRLIGFAETLQTAISGNRILSTIDELTRCGNRRFFEQQFPREVARAMRLRRPLAILMCDIDHFKSVNDRHGHQVGDEVLSEFGDRLSRGLRQGQDWAARIGGEEFAVVLPETGRAQAVAIAERLRRLVNARHFATNLGSIAVTASFGVCGVEDALPGREDLTAQMVIAADSALYTSKRQGRNRVTEGSAAPQAR
jgi:diguanylate cyclase (GGDEF)-like protein